MCTVTENLFSLWGNIPLLVAGVHNANIHSNEKGARGGGVGRKGGREEGGR